MLSCSLCLALLISCGGFVLNSSEAVAATLSFRFEDEAGDSRDEIDVTSVALTFDNVTGEYTVRVTADSSNPFDGRHLLYLSVFNPDVGSADWDVSFLNLVRFNVGSDVPSTVQTRTGVADVLTHWRPGDRVASYDVLGVPEGRDSFHSVLGGNSAAFADSDEILDVSVIVPESSSAMLLTAGFASQLLLLRAAAGRAQLRQIT